MTEAQITSDSKIKILPPRLANQIAAGEVVERPSSVVKELVENSIDSGANDIKISVEKGGLRLIRVTDNGCGISKDDLPLALSRHATSKLYAISDLNQISSLGFRGEALASISSVSRLKLTACEADSPCAWQAYCEGAQMTVSVVPASHPVGTSVEVAELFFNTPARRKFLKSEKTEFNHIDDLIRRLALSRYDVGFSLMHNGKKIRHFPRCMDEKAKLKRLTAILGKAFVEAAKPVEITLSHVRLNGYVALPLYFRAQRDQQFFFVNGRMLRDKVVQHAIAQAYEGQLASGMNPAFVLYLAIDPADVDVNVHPTKHEVRFRQVRWVHDFISTSVAEQLQQGDLGDSTTTKAQIASIDEQTESDISAPTPEDYQPLPLRVDSTQVNAGAHYPTGAAESGGYKYSSRQSKPQLTGFLKTGARQDFEAIKQFYAQTEKSQTVSVKNAHPYPVIARVHQKWWVIETQNGIAVLSQLQCAGFFWQAALTNLLSREGLTGQPLLLPHRVRLTKAEEIAITNLLDRLKISTQRLSDDRVMIRTLPAPLKLLEPQQMIDCLCAHADFDAGTVCQKLSDFLTRDSVETLFNTGLEMLREGGMAVNTFQQFASECSRSITLDVAL